MAGMKRAEQDGQDAFMRFEIDNPNPYAGTMFAEVWQNAFDAMKADYDIYLDANDAPLQTPESL